MGGLKSILWQGALLAWAVGLAACARGEGGTLRGTTALRVEAPAPSARRYETQPSEQPVVGPDAQAAAVRRGVARAAEGHGVEVRGDGRLGLLAAWTAEHLGPGGKSPPRGVVEFFGHHLGLVEPTPHLLVLGQPDPAAVEDAVSDSVAQFLARQRYNHYGAAVVERQGLTLTVVVLSARWIELEPIARRQTEGEPIQLSGRLLADYRDPKLVVAHPDGETERRALGGGTEVQGRLVPTQKGVHSIEILAKGPSGSSVVANFPVYVGVDVPREVSLEPEADADGGDTEQVATALLRLLNQTRAEAELPPLKRHDELGTVAEAHSRDMVEGGFVGHRSPKKGGAPQRVKQAGFRSGLVLENIGRGYGPAAIHRGLLRSPGHRANILNPDVTHVGIGVVAEEEGDRQAFVVTQIFLRMGSEIDVEGAPDELLEAINGNRRARDVPPLEADPNLREAAQGGVERFFEDPSLEQRDVVDDASAELRQFSSAFHRVSGLMVVVESLDEATRLEPLFDSDARYVGIGVAQGSRPDTPPNAIGVVIMLGWAR